MPVIVVLTKSYAKPQNAENIKMVQEQFDKHGPSANLKEIIPIVAIPYEVDDDYMVSQYGVEQLIEKTNEILKVVNERKRKKVSAINSEEKSRDAGDSICGRRGNGWSSSDSFSRCPNIGSA